MDDKDLLPKSLCGGQNDFLLTAHKESKGTSTPVSYDAYMADTKNPMQKCRNLHYCVPFKLPVRNSVEGDLGCNSIDLKRLRAKCMNASVKICKFRRIPSLLRYSNREGERLFQMLSLMQLQREDILTEH